MDKLKKFALPVLLVLAGVVAFIFGAPDMGNKLIDNGQAQLTAAASFVSTTQP